MGKACMPIDGIVIVCKKKNMMLLQDIEEIDYTIRHSEIKIISKIGKIWHF